MVPLNALGDVFADLGELGAAAGRQEVAQAGQRARAAGAREIPRRVRDFGCSSQGYRIGYTPWAGVAQW